MDLKKIVMRTFPLFALFLTSVLFLISSCQKEELIISPALEPTAVLEQATGNVSIVASGATIQLADDAPSSDYEYLTIGVSIDPCPKEGHKTLWVYQKLADDLLSAINPELYNIEWFNEDYELLGSTDTLSCVSEGASYRVIVWNIEDTEYAVLTITLN